MFYSIIFVIIFTAIIALQFKIKSTYKDYCVENLDCVASTCCHPNACVNKNYTQIMHEYFVLCNADPEQRIVTKGIVLA
jgi:hypothetical protein